MLEGQIKITHVDFADGKYKGTITLAELNKSMTIPYVLYCPANQRGLYDKDFPDKSIEYDYNELYPINYKNLLLEQNKVYEMAILLLQGELVDSSVLWNVRKSTDYQTLAYDENQRCLNISGTITVPDSAHRHKAYLTLFDWQNNPNIIPKKVKISSKEITITKEEIVQLIKDNFDPNKKIFVTILNVFPEKEGEIFRQMNMLTKKASAAQMIRVVPDLNPTTRFIRRLSEQCFIFNVDEIETNRTTIHKDSRKLVPISTLATAIKPFSGDLAIYEKYENIYCDLVNFIDNFFSRLADFYKEMAPKASSEDRHKSRKQRYIISNIMFIPLFRIAFELWARYNSAYRNWTNDAYYIRVIENLTKDIIINDDNHMTIKVNIMSKDNKQWIGKIANDKLQITNNRLSQNMAYEYLSHECNLESIKESISSIRMSL